LRRDDVQNSTPGGGRALSLMLIVCDAAECEACCNAQAAFYMQTRKNADFFIAMDY
jgi:hypothetical protein